MLDLYADDAEVEDPAGTEPKRADQILEFYTNAFAGGAKVELTGEICLSTATAAFPFKAEIKSVEGPVTRLHVIDIFEFDQAGKVRKMTAHFGPANMTVTDS
ncbi:nuclear transport factor 2 family protein [Parasphingorhabdus halotolerans]|uniref:Steroid delta-isomerase n=1 Tax=Parasphingorhabdus halotolerans TaxID=2725558 RepID=A0A6H2DPN3_9SPHN|nr:nuclear transport factor 2 family protein [Parasphingorhabdus halotolerans]QJB70158.1 steroid delta-isomerase [Parasphingorhabdus halotolerans]